MQQYVMTVKSSFSITVPAEWVKQSKGNMIGIFHSFCCSSSNHRCLSGKGLTILQWIGSEKYRSCASRTTLDFFARFLFRNAKPQGENPNGKWTFVKCSLFVAIRRRHWTTSQHFFSELASSKTWYSLLVVLCMLPKLTKSVFNLNNSHFVSGVGRRRTWFHWTWQDRKPTIRFTKQCKPTLKK